MRELQGFISELITVCLSTRRMDSEMSVESFRGYIERAAYGLLDMVLDRDRRRVTRTRQGRQLFLQNLFDQNLGFPKSRIFF